MEKRKRIRTTSLAVYKAKPSTKPSADPDDGYLCKDCTKSTSKMDEYYMVKDEIWLEAGMEPDSGMLCIGCLEERIGRQLTNPDFKDLPINNPSFFDQSRRLKNRLTIDREPDTLWK
jgi:hypothetical protein